MALVDSSGTSIQSGTTPTEGRHAPQYPLPSAMPHTASEAYGRVGRSPSHERFVYFRLQVSVSHIVNDPALTISGQ